MSEIGPTILIIILNLNRLESVYCHTRKKARLSHILTIRDGFLNIDIFKVE